eukprot:CAMPEP_0178411506 /NCGR_PEP_ID=MMETSP0689_2-20121128/21528_1 /TAXON_ID=160604 /ORGANISM="Amphidinium massartii, Strain CS-259" /LENGTH=610 /DNA_ID=CAMNT_0020032711 /DNA_START=35 /DNA_END=1864 /DNA_ORIENTATION=+
MRTMPARASLFGDEDPRSSDAFRGGKARQALNPRDAPQLMDPISLEHAYAEMETRLRVVIIEMLNPTVQVGRQQEAGLQGLREQVSDLARKVNEMFQLPTQVGRMQAILDSFRDELNKHDSHVHQAVTKAFEDVKLVRTELDGVQRSLEKRDTMIQHLQRNIDRVVMEFNRQQDRMADVEEIAKTVGNDFRREANQTACDLEAKITALEMKHHALTDELWGEEMGLAKVSGQLLKTNESIKTMQAKVESLEDSMVDAHHLEKLRSDVQNMLHKSETDLFNMKTAVGVAVTDTREHLQTALETTAAHNATFVDSVRKCYQEEISQSAKLREEVEAHIARTNDSIAVFDKRVEDAASKNAALLNEQREVIDEAERRRKRDRSSTDLELKGIKKRLNGIFESSDVITRGFELFSEVVSMMIKAVDMQCALDMQDTLDREHLSLLGVKESGVKEEVAPGSAQGSPLKRSPRKGLRQPPIVQVDQRCLSCSGQAASVLSAFKIACLQYCPSPVEYQQQEHTRLDLLRQMRDILSRARDVYSKGFLPDDLQRSGSKKPPADEDFAHAEANATRMLGEYASAAGYVVDMRSDAGGGLQLPSLNKPSPQQSPRITLRP